MSHIHLPFMTTSLNLLSPQIKAHTRLQAQIGNYKSSTQLSAVSLPPGTLRDLQLSFTWVWTALRALRQGQLPFQASFSMIFNPVAQEASFLNTWKNNPKVKTRTGRLVQLHDFALSLGRFVGLSGGICRKTQVNHGVQVDIKSKRQRKWKGSVVEHVVALWASWALLTSNNHLYATLNLGFE